MKTKEVNKPVGYKIELNPTEEQIQIFKKYFGATRYVYNYGVSIYNDNRNSNSKGYIQRIKFNKLTSKLTEHKKEATWLIDYDIYSLRVALMDVHRAVDNHLNPQMRYNEPRFKKKKQYSNHESFGVRGDRMSIWDNHVKLPSIGLVSILNPFDEVLGYGNKEAFTLSGRYINYIDTRIIFDGIDYYLSFSINEDRENGVVVRSNKRFRDNEIWNYRKHTEIIGLDFGCKDSNWLVSSNGTILEIPDLTAETKRIKKLQRKYNRQIAVNNVRWKASHPDIPTIKRPRTKNELKTLRKWNILEKRRTNKKLNALYNFISHNILQNKPSAVVIEDIFTTNMLQTDKSIPKFVRNRINYDVMKAMPFTVKDTITKTVTRNDIPVILADSEFPSSQLCSRCGQRTKVGKSRVFKCQHCGLTIDRDLNAALNLKNYGYEKLGLNKSEETVG